MRKFLSVIRSTGLCGVLGIALLWNPVKAQSVTVSPESAKSLKFFLQHFDEDRTTRYIAAFHDLNGDGIPEAIVYLMSNGWCGSGGCNTLVLTQSGDSWKVISNTTITRPPIRVLAGTSNGWHNIGVWVQGGGIQPGYEAELLFAGETYPRNPTMEPARRSGGKPDGDVVIASTRDATLLHEDQSARPVPLAQAPSRGPKPSFDCSKAATASEKLMCSDPVLAAMDRAMTAAYVASLQGLSPDQKALRRRDQMEWLSRYSRACNSLTSNPERKDCIVRHLSDRTETLRASAH